MPDIEINIAGWDIPMRNVYELVEVTEPLETTNITLDGTRYTDFRSPGNLRSWRIKFAYLCAEDYDFFREEVYLAQYGGGEYFSFTVPFYDIADVPVKISVSDKNIKMDGDHIVDYEIILDEQYAIS